MGKICSERNTCYPETYGKVLSSLIIMQVKNTVEWYCVKIKPNEVQKLKVEQYQVLKLLSKISAYNLQIVCELIKLS